MDVLPMCCKTVDIPMTTQNGAVHFVFVQVFISLKLCCFFGVGLGSIDYIMDANLSYGIKP